MTVGALEFSSIKKSQIGNLSNRKNVICLN
jgi:hypothetical protein